MTTLAPSAETDRSLEREVVAVLLVLTPLAGVGYRGLSLGVAASLLGFAVVLARQVRQFRGAKGLLVAVGFCLLSVPILVRISTSAGNPFDGNHMWRTVLLLVTAATSAAVLLWGRRAWGTRQAAFLFGLGLLGQGLLDRASWAGDPWKFALAWPVTVMVLSRLHGKAAQVAALIAFAGISIAFDFRSFAGLCILAAAFVLIPWRPGRVASRGRLHWLKPLVLLVAGGYVLLHVGTALALNGSLGSEIQARSAAQATSGHSLLIEARPESAASWALFKRHPLGFGPGVAPTSAETTTATTALQNVGRNTDSTYVTDYLFGDEVELHSVAADLWANFGPAGLVLALLLAFTFVRALADRSALPVFLALLGLWDLAFSPLTSNLLHVVGAAALLLSYWPRQTAAPGKSSHAEPVAQTGSPMVVSLKQVPVPEAPSVGHTVVAPNGLRLPF